MSKRRAFSTKIIRSDAFLEMPLSSQALYFHLLADTDDDGFVDSPKGVLRTTGAAEDDLKLLIAKRFVIAFESGVVVIRHFKAMNTLQNDRYQATVYRNEFNLLKITHDRSYQEFGKVENVEILTPFPECIQNVSTLDTEWKHNITEHNITKHNITKHNKKEIIAPTSSEVEPAIFQIPLSSQKENPKSYGVTQADIDYYAELYPAVDVSAEIRKMIGWCDANPSRRKTARGIKAFIATWLSKEQDKGGRLKGASQTPDGDAWFIGGAK